ncbi:MAG: ATP-binding cassette domain-containing protein [Magnetococcales bacterium]|nr:ATP-binding cassette domain-containing protein [Magnetococcales bacterium]
MPGKDRFFSDKGWPARLTPFSMVSTVMGDLFLVSFMINLLGLALPLTLLQVYDRILQFQAVSTLVFLILGVTVALLLEGVLRMGRSYIGAWLGARFEHLAACSAMERLLTTNLAAFERDGSGVHLERLNALAILKDFYAGQAVAVILDIPFVAIYLGLVYHLAQGLVLVPVVVFILFVIFVHLIGEQLHKLVGGRIESDDRRINFIIEILGGIHAIKSMAMEAMMLRRYERLSEACAKGAEDVGLQGADSANIGAFFAQVSMVGVVSFGAIMVVEHQLTIGGLSACTMLAGRALQPLQRAVGIWTRFQTIRLAKDRVAKIFELPADDSSNKPSIPEVVGRLTLEDVSFGFDDKKPPLLHDLNLDVAPGETIGISGDNGSGKTILLWLMMGALKPTKGRVLIDGYDLATHNVRDITDKVSYLPQVGMLFRGSILENIHMFRNQFIDEAIKVAKILELEEFVSKLPKGFETVIDDGADESIPRGIKQRITLARSLVNHPKVVLFDEANTGIDGRGDENLKNVLMGMKDQATIILISARPSLLNLAQRSFLLKNGTLVPKPPPPAAANTNVGTVQAGRAAPSKPSGGRPA